jgi:hypothetical protein
MQTTGPDDFAEPALYPETIHGKTSALPVTSRSKVFLCALEVKSQA